MNATASLAEWALFYARDGLRIFPLRPGGKAPLTRRGFKAATRDEATIRQWWTATPNANIGAATGNGVIVVDVDPPEGPDSLRGLFAEHGQIATLTGETPRGGSHLWLRVPKGVTVRNSAGKLGSGLDVRGDGGYVVLPPSRLKNGRTYEWRQTTAANPPALSPSWLLDLLKPSRHEESLPRMMAHAPVEGTAYGRAALEAKLGRLAGAPQGTRNDTLNSAAFAIAQLEAGGELAEGTAERELGPVALTIGLPADEVERTLRSAISAGYAEPRRAPNSQRQPVLTRSSSREGLDHKEETSPILDERGVDMPPAWPAREAAVTETIYSPAGGFGIAPTRDLLGAVEAVYARFLVLPSSHEAAFLALWTLHTHVMDAASTTPYGYVTSPEKESGKSTVLEAAALLVRRPIESDNISVAATFRVIEELTPTLLIDEVDQFFGRTGDPEAAEFRSILNAGYRRDKHATRCVGPMHKVTQFRVFCPKLLVGLDRGLPDTLASRCVRIEMRRQTAAERRETLRARHGEETRPLREAIEAWAEATVEELGAADPPAIAEPLLSLGGGRWADMWEPLLAIADHAGGGWSRRAHAAMRALHERGASVDASLGVQLLASIRDVRDRIGGSAITTVDLLIALVADEEAPWLGKWRDPKGRGLKPSAPRSLSTMLRPFGIPRTKTVRPGGGYESGGKGYEWEWFEDAFARYLDPVPGPTPASNPSDPSDPSNHADLRAADHPSEYDRGCGMRRYPASTNDRKDRTDREPEAGKKDDRFCAACTTPDLCAERHSCAEIERLAALAREAEDEAS